MERSKIMKKFHYLLLTILIITIVTNTSFKAQPINTLLKKEVIANAADKKFIKNVLAKEITQPIEDIYRDIRYNPNYIKGVKLKSIDQLSYGVPFKVVFFVDNRYERDTSKMSQEVFKKFLNGEKLADILKNGPYSWELPILYNNGHFSKPVSSVQITSVTIGRWSGGKWHVSTYSSHLDPETSYLCSQPDKMAEWLKEKGITYADKIMYVNMYDYYFIYVLLKNKEYYIPLTKYCSHTPTEKFKVYSRSEFQSIYEPYMKKIVKNIPLDGTLYITAKPKSDNLNSNKINTNRLKSIIILCSIASLSALYYIYKKAYKKSWQ